jgi:uncharacterized protein (TIGR03435 family)
MLWKYASRVLPAALTVVGIAVTAFGQDAAHPTFDAVSIHRVDPGTAANGGLSLGGGNIRSQNLPILTLIAVAHQLDSYRVLNEPEWTRTLYFDIVARANATPTREETFAMMRAMLAERFKLAAHRETRALPGFALVRVGTTLGTSLQPSRLNCEDNPTDPQCRQGGFTPGDWRAVGIPIINIANLVSGYMAAPIVDRSGLTGTFDLRLRWSKDGSPSDDAPVLPTALQEQLGLRLQREDVAGEVLVIDHIERPTEN